VHGLALKTPVALPEKFTLPVSAIVVPADEMSVTVAVHETDWLTSTETGEHAKLVDVVLFVTFSVNVPLLLP